MLNKGKKTHLGRLLPPGILKAKVTNRVDRYFAKKPADKVRAEKTLYPYLAASALYAAQGNGIRPWD